MGECGRTSLILAFSLVATAAASGQEGMLQGLAKQAKAEGQKSIKVSNFYHWDIVGQPADAFLRDFSIAVVTPISAVTTATQPDNIFSWQRARLEKMLRVGPEPSRTDFDQVKFCADLPKPASYGPLREREIRITTSGGTVTLDGINVTVDTGTPLNLSAGQKYLVMGLNCDAVIAVPTVDGLVFAVDAGGNISGDGRDDQDYARKLLQLKTIADIERYVRGIR